jgi:hypothetical protein
VSYATIDWNKARNQVAQEDLYYPHPFIQVRAAYAFGGCMQLP